MDTRDTKLQNLLFLLAAAPLGMGGCIITDGEDDGADTSNASTGTQPNTSGETDPATDGETEQGTVDGGSGTTAGPVETDGPADSSGTTTDEPPPDGVCEEYAAFITYCYTEKEGAGALYSCQEYLPYLYDTYGAGCATAYEDYLACLSMLTCEEFASPEACPDEQAAIAAECVAG